MDPRGTELQQCAAHTNHARHTGPGLQLELGRAPNQGKKTGALGPPATHQRVQPVGFAKNAPEPRHPELRLGRPQNRASLLRRSIRPFEVVKRKPGPQSSNLGHPRVKLRKLTCGQRLPPLWHGPGRCRRVTTSRWPVAGVELAQVVQEVRVHATAEVGAKRGLKQHVEAPEADRPLTSAPKAT